MFGWRPWDMHLLTADEVVSAADYLREKFRG